MNEIEVPRSPEQTLPKVSYRIVYTNHRTAKDFEWLPSELEQCDIFVPEFYRWDDNTAKAYKAVSSGIFSPEEALDQIGISPQSPWLGSWMTEMKALHNSQKEATFI